MNAGYVIHNELSFCLMETNHFWDLIDQQLQENETDPSKCDVVCGEQSKIRHKKRKNVSLERTREECKQQRLEKCHLWRAKWWAHRYTKKEDEAITAEFRRIFHQKQFLDSDGEVSDDED